MEDHKPLRANAPFHIIRRIVFALVFASAVAVLTINAWLFRGNPESEFTSILAISASGTTTLLLLSSYVLYPYLSMSLNFPDRFIIECLKENSKLISILTELLWAVPLSLFWFAVGTFELNAKLYPPEGWCRLTETCNFAHVILYLAFIVAGFLLAWCIALFVYGIRGKQWTSPIPITDLRILHPKCRGKKEHKSLSTAIA
jgi:hypothetical protein